MGVVDRTGEFRNIILDLSQGQGIVEPFGQQQHAQSELNVISAQIGSDIHKTSLRVQELRKLSKQKGIFQESLRQNQIDKMTLAAQQDLARLNAEIEALKKKAKGQGPNRSYEAHSKNMVETLKTRSLQVTKDFKDALEDRSKTLVQQDKRRQMYSTNQSLGTNTFQHRQQPTPMGNADDPESGGLPMAQQLQYHSSRAEAVQNVQRTIGELGTMFQKMAVLVTQQEEMIQRIDHDMDSTLDNVEKAQNQLLQYFHHISSNRALILKVFGILIFFVVFFIVFLA